jgi:hypothetical protein
LDSWKLFEQANKEAIMAEAAANTQSTLLLGKYQSSLKRLWDGLDNKEREVWESKASEVQC